jgi:hypothetical protein
MAYVFISEYIFYGITLFLIVILISAYVIIEDIKLLHKQIKKFRERISVLAQVAQQAELTTGIRYYTRSGQPLDRELENVKQFCINGKINENDVVFHNR